MINFSSIASKSLPLNFILCLFAVGPREEGVGGTAEDGVGGWGRVAEAGVRALI